jgi:hypothetical protein
LHIDAIYQFHHVRVLAMGDSVVWTRHTKSTNVPPCTTRWYWLKSELMAFARESGVSPQGGKQEIAERICTFLDGEPVEDTPEVVVDKNAKQLKVCVCALFGVCVCLWVFVNVCLFGHQYRSSVYVHVCVDLIWHTYPTQLREMKMDTVIPPGQRLSTELRTFLQRHVCANAQQLI